MEYYNCYYEGIFWIPGNENYKIIATLHIDEEGVVTISSLQSLVHNQKNGIIHKEWREINIVFGFINSHDLSTNYSVKLYNVYQVHQSDGGLTKYKYRSSNSLISKGIDEKIDQLSYNSIMLSSDKVSKWIPISGFKYDSSHENKVFKVSQLYEQPKRINLFENEDFTIYFFFRASAGYPVNRNSYIKEEILIIIEPSNSYELKQLYKIKATVERLLNIILFIPFYSTTVEFRSVSGINYRELSKSKELSKGQSNPLNFKIFNEKSQEIFEKWFEKQKVFELFIKNFFSVFGRKGVLIENKFLTYVSVLENYHKNNVKETATLKVRLSYLLQNSSFNEIIVDIDKYAEKLKVTRNYHAHLEEKHEKKSLDSNGIVNSNRILEIIIHEIMLQDLGVSEFKMPQTADKNINEINKILE